MKIMMFSWYYEESWYMIPNEKSDAIYTYRIIHVKVATDIPWIGDFFPSHTAVYCQYLYWPDKIKYDGKNIASMSCLRQATHEQLITGTKHCLHIQIFNPW